jgi:hypothetical protein
MFQSNIRSDLTFLINSWHICLIIWPNPSYMPDLSHIFTLSSNPPTVKIPSHNPICRLYIKWSVIAQLVYRLAMDCTVRGSNPGGSIPQKSRPALGPTQHPVIWVLLIFPVVKGTGAWCWPPIHIYRRGKRKSRAIHLLPLCPFMAFSIVHFTFAVYKRPVLEVFILGL